MYNYVKHTHTLYIEVVVAVVVASMDTLVSYNMDENTNTLIWSRQKWSKLQLTFDW